MYLNISANCLHHLHYQVYIVPFFFSPDTKLLAFPPAFLEASAVFGENCVNKLHILREEQTIYQPYYWVKLLNKPPILFYNDIGKNPVQQSLHNAINHAYYKNLMNIGLFLFRHQFGYYHIKEHVLAEVTLEECRECILRPDINIHLLFSSSDKQMYEFFEVCPFVREEYAPNFTKQSEES